MTILLHDELPNSSSKRCRSLSSSLKDAFSDCHTSKRSRSVSSHEDEPPIGSYFSDELQVVSIVRARAMEAKFRRKSIHWDEHFSSVLYHVTLSELFMRTPNQNDKEEDNDIGSDRRKKDGNDDEEEEEEFLSAVSHFSGAGYASSEFFECSGLEEVVEMFPELRRRSIIQEFSHCKGWPFGLRGRVMLLPPLPKSPSDSWSWCKRVKIVTEH